MRTRTWRYSNNSNLLLTMHAPLKKNGAYRPGKFEPRLCPGNTGAYTPILDRRLCAEHQVASLRRSQIGSIAAIHDGSGAVRTHGAVRERRDVHEQRAFVLDGCLPEREVWMAAAPIAVKVPKVPDRTGSGVKFNSSIVPRYVRKSLQSIEIEYLVCGPPLYKLLASPIILSRLRSKTASNSDSSKPVPGLSFASIASSTRKAISRALS